MTTTSQALAAGLAQHQAGQYQQAEMIYQQVLSISPNSTETLHLLGLLAFQMNQPVRAGVYLDQAIALEVTNPILFTTRATVYRTLGDLRESAATYRQALRLAPDDAQTHYNLGLVLVELDDIAEATDCFRRAIELNPNFAQAHYNLGLVLEQQDLEIEAEAAYRRSIQIDPGYMAALHNLGRLLGQQHRFDEACKYMEKAVQLDPQDVARLFNLGLLFWKNGQITAAAKAYQFVLQRDPLHGVAHLNLAIALEKLGDLTEVETHYRAAILLNPTEATAYHNLGLLLNWQGRAAEALSLLEIARLLNPTSRYKYDSALVLPKIYQSRAEIEQWRQHQINQLVWLEQTGIRFDSDQEKYAPNFYLAYQGFNDKAIHETIARLYLSPSEPFMTQPSPPEGKIHIGFISAHFKAHTITRLNQGLIANLSRDKFIVTLFVLEDKIDDFVDFLKACVDQYVVLPQNLPDAREKIRHFQPDILYYTDIGMEEVTYALATTRLASVQCVTWGHPVTTGLKTIDYFISSKLFERSQAQYHYTEKLVLMKGPTIFYTPPTLPQPQQGREFFGLSPQAHIYLCPQTLFKFHPDFDYILESILEGDPLGQLVLIEGQVRQWQDILLQRFKQTIPQVVDRVCILPAQSHENFLNLLAVADVMLDTIHFGGGNTTLEALALGTPVVTLPSEFLRGRLTYGFYQKMGLSDCIAHNPKQYVEIALKLGLDPIYRAEVSQNIIAAHPLLFENIATVREFEQFFITVLLQQQTYLSPAYDEVNL